MIPLKRFVLAILALLAGATVASAAPPLTLTAIGPFTGTHSESFESFNDYDQGPNDPNYLPQGTSIMGGFATISSVDQDMLVYNPSAGAEFGFYEGSSGYFLNVADGSQGLGLDKRVTITFSQPVTSFGGYFGALNEDPAIGLNGKVTFDFFNSSAKSATNFIYSNPIGDNPIGVDPSPLVWEGWDFSAGITSIQIAGNDVALDELEASVPDGGRTSLMLGGMLLGLGLAERRKIVRA